MSEQQPADEPVIDMGYLSLPAEVQQAAEADVAARRASPSPAPAEPSGEAAGPAEGDDEATPGEPHISLLKAAWGIIANAGWDAFSGRTDLPKTTGWHEAAVRWRDDYHRWLDLHLRPGGYQTWEELATGLVRERDALAYEVTRLRGSLHDAADTQSLAIKADEEPRDA